MFDPLGNSSAAAFGDDDDASPWPATPVLNSSSTSSLVPPTPDKGPTPGIYGKEPQIYGQPEAGLVSPQETTGSNGTKFEKPDPYLRVRITGLDRNRRDILIKLDAQTTLSNFTGTTYRNVSRSYLEFQQFYDSIVHNNPQTIIPALPLAQTSAPTDEEDDRLVRIMLQRWITRVCEDPILLHDEDLRSFIENDFGYQPMPRLKRKTSTGFSLIRRNVPDEDEELQRARFELTKLEGQFFETAKAVDKLSATRKTLAAAHIEMGNKLINVATTENHPPLANALRKIGRTWHSLADLDQAQAISECVIIGDSLGYQGINARSAKETLQMRTGVLEEYQAAVKTTISKRRNIERLKASSNIRADRVDEALEDMEEANKYEQTLARRAEGISQNLHTALRNHSQHAGDDITSALIEHARSSILYERQRLRELEALKADVENADKKVAQTASVPRPTIIPPLEDFSRPPPPREEPDRLQQHFVPRRNGPPTSAAPPVSQYNSDPLGSASPTVAGPPQQQPRPDIGPSNGPFSRHDPPMSAPPHRPFTPSSIQSGPSSSTSAGPSSPRVSGPSPLPNTAPASPISAQGAPLGGRLVDGSKSMFVRATTPQVSSPLHGPSYPASPSSQSTGDPLMGSPALGPTSGSTPNLAGAHPPSEGLDPLGQARPTYMSQSVRVQPTRPRLDAREAASKLANMF